MAPAPVRLVAPGVGIEEVLVGFGGVGVALGVAVVQLAKTVLAASKAPINTNDHFCVSFVNKLSFSFLIFPLLLFLLVE